MAFLGIVERVVQDSANVATTSGLSIAKLTPTLSPSSLIQEGNERLVAVGECLRTSCLPERVEKRFFLRQDDLLNEGQRLLGEKSRLGFLKQVVLIGQALHFRDSASKLHGEAMLTSEVYRVRRYLRYSLSTHTLDSWEHVSPPSPQVAPADMDVACELSQVPVLQEGRADHEVEHFELHAPSCDCAVLPMDTPTASTTGMQSSAVSEGES